MERSYEVQSATARDLRLELIKLGAVPREVPPELVHPKSQIDCDHVASEGRTRRRIRWFG